LTISTLRSIWQVRPLVSRQLSAESCCYNDRRGSTMRITRRLVAFAALIAAFSLELTAQNQTAATAPSAAAVKARYTKHELQIPMRDGVKLFTSVYVPKDTSTTCPILLQRTPYGVGPYGPEAYRNNVGPSDLFMKDGYIVAYQDVRGRFMSEGE